MCRHRGGPRWPSQGVSSNVGKFTFPPGMPFTCPSPFSPQHRTEPAGSLVMPVTTAHVWKPPAARSTARIPGPVVIGTASALLLVLGVGPDSPLPLCP